MAVDEQWDNTTIEDIAEGMSWSSLSQVGRLNKSELPENAPRYVILLHEVVSSDNRRPLGAP